jgi:glycosyltransferase involved in cell wall biosynthesis
VKLSCAMIVRDDESTLEDCLRSIRPHVDEIVVCDTGSIDASPEIAKRYADRWELFLGCNGGEHGLIEDFAMARNHSFSLATGDWILWVDADDVMRGGEHMHRLCSEATADYQTFLFQYEYSRDALGNVTCLQMRERLMRPPHAYTWRSPVHEHCSLEGTPDGTVANVATDLVVIEHRSHLSQKVREPGRNLRILKSYVSRVGEADVRALYYLGVEYASIGDRGESLRYLKRYVQLADWDDEKCKALLTIGEHYRQIGDHEHANEWTLRAMTTKRWPEPYFALGRSYYAMAQRGERPEYNYRRAASFIMDGLERPTDVVLFANPQERALIHAQLNICFHATGNNERALWSCEEGLKACPPELRAAIEADPAAYEHHPFAMMLQNRREYLKGGKLVQIHAAVKELRELGAITEQQVALVRAALKGDLRIETEESRPPVLPAAPSRLEPQQADPGKLDVVLFLGPALERWSPETWAKNGMGGSETMAWEMARRLRRLGHRVRVYVDCTPAQEGLYEGVEWVAWQRFRGVECDVLIASRFPWAVDDQVSVSYGENGTATIGGCKASVRLLWVHDVNVGDTLDLRRTARIDRILCLSEWHKGYFVGCYQGIDATKVHVTRNGIDLSRFDGAEERDPHRAVYSSSPDRGLLAAVMAWPLVRAKVPDAELHVFYGWLNWELSARQANDQAQLRAIQHLKNLCEKTPGIVMRDRVNQRELAREFMRAGVWCYPTWFSETSCVTAMEAQAAGLMIVTSPLAALVETVADRGVMLKEHWDYVGAPSGAFIAETAELTVEAMREAEQTEGQRSMDYARDHFGLDTLAEEWSEMMLKMRDDLEVNPVAKFQGAAE